ncbi:MFS transporter, partial [Candidatus Latescibacterota bacterium]
MTTHNSLKFEILRLSIFLVFLLSYILVFFHRMAPGVASSDLMEAFNTTGTSLGALASMYFIIYAVMQLPSGVLADTLGVRKTV